MASNSGGGHGASMNSWLCAAIIVAGFIIGGIAVIVWNWPLFWVGVAVAVLGGVYGAATGIMDDVTEYGGGGSGGDPESSSY